MFTPNCWAPVIIIFRNLSIYLHIYIDSFCNYSSFTFDKCHGTVSTLMLINHKRRFSQHSFAPFIENVQTCSSIRQTHPHPTLLTINTQYLFTYKSHATERGCACVCVRCERFRTITLNDCAYISARAHVCAYTRNARLALLLLSHKAPVDPSQPRQRTLLIQ